MNIGSSGPAHAQQAHRAAPVAAPKSAPVPQGRAPIARPAAHGDSISRGGAAAHPTLISAAAHPATAKVGGVKN